jgi:hypothetical protein
MRSRFILAVRSEFFLEVRPESRKRRSRLILAVCTLLMCGGSIHEPRGIIQEAEGRAEGKALATGDAEALRVVHALSIDA